MRFASLALVLAWSAAAQAAPAFTALTGGKIYTGNPLQPWAEAVLMAGNRIAVVGSTAEVTKLAALSHARVTNVGGRTIIAGLNDAHAHVLPTPGVLVNDPSFIPGPGPTLSEVQADLTAASAQTPAGTVLTALVGTNFSDDPDATRFALDGVSPNHLVVIQAWSGHGLWVNTAMLEAVGISSDAPDPFGGFYDRLPGTNILSGVLHEYAEYDLRRLLFARYSTPAQLAAEYKADAQQRVALGFTSIQDMAIGLPYRQAIAAAVAANSPIRTREICFPLSPDESCEATPSGRVSASGIKWITDGTPIERRAFLNEPYSDAPNTRGVYDFSKNQATAFALRSIYGGPLSHQLILHTVGDGALDNNLDALERTGGAAQWYFRRPRLEHADLLFQANITRAKKLGAIVVQNGTHLALTALWYQRFPELVATMEPLKSLLDQGVALALGTDSIGSVISPWLDIYLTVIHPTRPSEALTVAQAITAFTRGSAYAEFAEFEKGVVAPGFLADLVVLSQDPFTVPVDALPATHAALTYIGGALVFSDGEVQ